MRTPEQLEQRKRRNVRLAMAGIVLGAVVTIGAAIGWGEKINDNVNTLKHAAAEKLVAPSAKQKAAQHITQRATEPEPVRASFEQPSHSNPIINFVQREAVPLGSIGGAMAFSCVALLGMGAACRPKHDEQYSDVETDPDYYEPAGLLEAQQHADDQEVADQVCLADLQALDDRLDTLCATASTTYVRAALGSQLNILHLNVLQNMGEPPARVLTALTYAP